MKELRTLRGKEGFAVAYLSYWAFLAAGAVTACVALELPGPRAWALVAGTATGTAMGQMCASNRWRLWASLGIGLSALVPMAISLVLAQVVWTDLVPPLVPYELQELGSHFLLLNELSLALTAYAPAALCSYLLLTEYGSLASLWFPLALWMLPILEPSPDAGKPWAFVCVAASLLLGCLYLRERRRVAVWRTTSSERLSVSARASVPRRSPLRAVRQGGGLAALGAAMLVITGWLAPHLWQEEISADSQARLAAAAAAAEAAAAGRAGGACCPSAAELDHQRVHEYLPLLSFKNAAGPASTATIGCVPCSDGVPIASAGSGSAGVGKGTAAGGDPAETGPSGSTTGSGGIASNSGVPVTTSATSIAPGTSVEPASTAIPPHAPPPVALEPPDSAEPMSHVPIVSTVAAPRSPGRLVMLRAMPTKASLPAVDVSPFVYALLLVGLALLAYVGIRPVRRWVTLRHFQRPLFRQSVSQEVSNGWQWMLVALRDGGWHVLPGEQPGALARRIGLPGLAAGAAVLERARHGVRLDASDAQAMRAAAPQVYADARKPLGRAARAVSWFRWPLV
jgi:hypothetical protein